MTVITILSDPQSNTTISFFNNQFKKRGSVDENLTKDGIEIPVYRVSLTTRTGETHLVGIDGDQARDRAALAL